MTTIDEHGRPDPPMPAGEAATLPGFLEFHRATFAWKTSGLDANALAATTAKSSLTLGGLLKHLAFVEDFWFSYRFEANPPAAPWDTVDWDNDPDWDFTSATQDSPEQLRTAWSDSIARSRTITELALGLDDALDAVEKRPRADGDSVNLRWILIHMVEEYSRHNGHADLLREAVDGLRGE